MSDWVPPETLVRPVQGYRELIGYWLNADIPGDPIGFYRQYLSNVFVPSLAYLCGRSRNGEALIRCSERGTVHVGKLSPYDVIHTTGTISSGTSLWAPISDERRAERIIVSARDYPIGVYLGFSFQCPDDPIVVHPGENREIEFEFNRVWYQTMGAGTARFRFVMFVVS